MKKLQFFLHFLSPEAMFIKVVERERERDRERQTGRETERGEKGERETERKRERGGEKGERETERAQEHQSATYDCTCMYFVANFLFVGHSSSFSPDPNKPMFIDVLVCSTSLTKSVFEKEKLLVGRNSSFSHSIFYPFLRTFC